MLDGPLLVKMIVDAEDQIDRDAAQLAAGHTAALRVQVVARRDGGSWRVPNHELRALLRANGVSLPDEERHA